MQSSRLKQELEELDRNVERAHATDQQTSDDVIRRALDEMAFRQSAFDGGSRQPGSAHGADPTPPFSISLTEVGERIRIRIRRTKPALRGDRFEVWTEQSKRTPRGWSLTWNGTAWIAAALGPEQPERLHPRGDVLFVELTIPKRRGNDELARPFVVSISRDGKVLIATPEDRAP